MSNQGRGQSKSRVTCWYFVGRHNLDEMMRDAQAQGIITGWDDCRGDGIWFDAAASQEVRDLIGRIEAAGLRRSSNDRFYYR